jgi:hypothetical protein
LYAAVATEDALGLGPGEEEDEGDAPVFRLPTTTTTTARAAPSKPGHNRVQSKGWDLGVAASPKGGRNIAAEMERGIRGEDVLFDEEDDELPPAAGATQGRRSETEGHR